MTCIPCRRAAMGLGAWAMALATAVFAQSAAAPLLDVVVAGLDERPELQRNVEQTLTLWTLRGEPSPDAVRLAWLRDQIPREVAMALEPFGFYQPTVTVAVGDVAAAENRPPATRVTIAVTPGEPLRYHTSQITLQGESASDDGFSALRDPPALRVGEVVNHPAYEAFKGQLGDVALRRGYFDARLVRSDVLIDLPDAAAPDHLVGADLAVVFDSGTRYRFGPLAFNQTPSATATQGWLVEESLLRRYVTFAEDAPYLDETVLSLQTALLGSRYFRDVTVHTAPDAANRHVPVNFDLVPDVATYYTFALGYGTDTGPRGSMEIERPLLNRHGHSYEAKLLASFARQGLGGEYRIPGFYPPTDRYLGRFNLLNEELTDQRSRRVTLGVGQQRTQGAWTTRYNLDYQFESFSIGNQGFKTSRLLLPSATVNWVSADNRVTANRGIGVDATVRGALQGLLSDISLVQGTSRLRGIYAVTDRLRVLQRVELGATWVSDFDGLPTSLRFTAGGDGSVRGYSLGAIGPKVDGKVVGGRYLFTTSSELEYRVADPWAVAAFVDGGTAFDDQPEMQLGVGVGVRFRSPVGPIRVDFSHGLGDDGETFALSFSLGPDF